jgi:2-amino-4-hydroxy-6-hydroxymethyldihydropteridine diphosphokinase
LNAVLDAVVGLGSNVGDRLATLRRAVRALERRMEIVARSRVYETEPVGPPQPDYLNAAVRVHFGGEPLALLDVLSGIEAALGRDRASEVRWGPRTLDLDVLWIAGRRVDEERLVVPHPRLAERAFALRPLLDVAPDATDGTGTRYLLPPDAERLARVFSSDL